jgi:Cu(I)/Ag(I) efflux system membrane fusion protein/cobalt-zinc-cadmium efflux system membrane fusion protein
MKSLANRSQNGPSIIKAMAFTALVTLLVSAGAAYFFGYLKMPGGQQQTTPQGTPPGERKIAHWRAPMNPAEIYDRPGKSAMGMDLVPVYEDELVGGVVVTIDPVIRQNMGVRTAVVEKRPLTHVIRTYGHVTPDETRTFQVTLKTDGWIEKLHVDFTGKFVARGEPLFEFYSPALLSAQEELLVSLRNLERSQTRLALELTASARRRLSYFDLSEQEIERIVASGTVSKSVTIHSPFSGYVVRKEVQDGVFVKSGALVFQIVDLSRVWVEAHIFEYELPWIEEGQEAEMSLPYLPGRKFTGRVAYVYPTLQPKTRDVVIRLEFENPGLLLKPDMYADVRIKARAGEEGVVVPTEAVIRSGERNLVFVTRDENKFSPREVSLGLTMEGGKIQVLNGLAPGEIVVVSGQFLLDSESKLKEAVQKMLEAKSGKPVDTAAPEDKDESFFDDLETEADFFRDLEQH